MSANVKYGLLQATYWMLYCIGYGYVTYYLQSFGFAAGEIGILTAVFGLIAAFTQTRLGNLADTSERWGWKQLLSLLALANLATVVLMGIVSAKLATGLLFGVFLVLITSMMPLVNAACFAYQDKGVTIDFGKARGIGSLSYAAISYVLGRLTVSFGTLPIVVTGVIDTLILFLVVRSMEDVRATKSKTADEASTGSGSKGFFSKYPAFMLMVAGLVLLLTFHNAINTYMLQLMQNVGGDSATMGTAISIAAVCELPVMFGFSKISKRFSVQSLLLVCGLAYVARGLLLVFASNVWAIYAQQVLQMLSFAMYASASVYYTDLTMKPQDKVTGQALMSGVATLGAVIGNLFGGWALQLAGVSAMMVMLTAFAVVGTIVVAVSCKRAAGTAVARVA